MGGILRLGGKAFVPPPPGIAWSQYDVNNNAGNTSFGGKIVEAPYYDGTADGAILFGCTGIECN